MTTPNRRQSEEPLLSGDASEESPKKTMCRLETGLNNDCLLKVLSYLNQHDLFQLARVDDYFKKFIGDEVWSRKLIHFRWKWNLNGPELDPGTVEELETFGKYIQRIKDGVNLSIDFNFFVETMVKYVKPATLKEVDMKFRFDNWPYEINVKCAAIFSNVRKLRFYAHSPLFDPQILIEKYFNKIEILRLDSTVIKDLRFLKKLHNLSELQIEGEFTIDELNMILLAKPYLKSLKIHLSRLSLEDKYNAMETMEGGSNIVVDHYALEILCVTGIDKFNLLHRRDFFSSFPNLHTLTLMSKTVSGCDLLFPLVILAARKIVKLKFILTKSDIDRSESLVEGDIRKVMETNVGNQFVHLRFVEICCVHGGSHYDLNIHGKFIFKFLSQLKNVKTIKLAGGTIKNLNKYMELGSSIQKVDMADIASLTQPPVEIRKFVLKLRQIRDENKIEPDQQLLQLVVNGEQLREFMVIKNTKSILKIIHVRRWANDEISSKYSEITNFI